GRAPRAIRASRQWRWHDNAHRPNLVCLARPAGVVLRLVDASHIPRRAYARNATHQAPCRNPAVIFQFIVRRLRWLARMPLVPHLFDALLLAWTALFHRQRMAALEALEAHTLQLPGVVP